MAERTSCAIWRMPQAEAERIKAAALHFLAYDPLSGAFTWKVRRSQKCKVGLPAGSVTVKGYVAIQIAGKSIAAHRLAWMFMTGEFPDFDVDHINMIKSDNRWENLRLATSTQNKANSGKRSDTSNPYKGIRRSGSRWRAVITRNGVSRSFGPFPTPEQAHAAYVRAAVELFGEFARTG